MDLWDCPWLLLMLLCQFPQNLGQKLGQIQETSWISPIFNPDGRDLLGSTISKKLGIGELLKSRSQFWSGGTVPIVLVHVCYLMAHCHHALKTYCDHCRRWNLSSNSVALICEVHLNTNQRNKDWLWAYLSLKIIYIFLLISKFSTSQQQQWPKS